jgi:hypothetical protein
MPEPSDLELVMEVLSERRTHYEVLEADSADFVALYSAETFPDRSNVIATLPFVGAKIVRRPLGKAHRAGSLELCGLNEADAIARAERANAGLGLEVHRWS